MDMRYTSLRVIRSDEVGVWLFIFLCIIIYAIPDSIQLPFRLVFLFLSVAYFLIRYQAKISCLQFGIIAFLSFILGFKLYTHSFDTSLLMVCLSVIPVMNIKCYVFPVKYFNALKVIVFLLCFAIIAQLAIYRYEGRPTLSYEINQSGSYLFLFFLLSDALRFRSGKYLVLLASFLLLSRLLILCLLVFYVIRYLEKHFNFLLKWITYSRLLLGANFFLILFSFWFFISFSGKALGGGDDFSRLTTLSDGSNFQRFKINTEVVLELLSGNQELLISGYGDLGVNKAYIDRFFLMPHNELLKATAQFGLLFVVFFFFISKKAISPFINRDTIAYFIPIVIYTLILWVRFTIIPSIEMILILFIFSIKMQSKLWQTKR